VKHVAIAWARFATSAWVGAATLFVITSVMEVTDPRLESTVRDILVAVRFPAFYATGAVLLGTAWLATLVGRRWFSAVLLAVTLGLMAADYVAVYQPLVELVTPPGRPRTEAFQSYHRWSEGLNGVELLLSLVAALTLCSRNIAPAANEKPAKHL
jgi:hypothetical protein